MDGEEENATRSLQDLMRQRGVDFEASKRRADKENDGCVIRAVESAFGINATDEEVDERLNQVREAERQVREHFFSEENSDAFRQAVSDLIIGDMDSTERYYETLSTHDSPLGRAMSDYTMSRAKLLPDEIRLAIQEGKKVLIAATIPGIGNHMLHIGYNQTGFRSISDELDFQLRPEDRYTAFIFSQQNPQE